MQAWKEEVCKEIASVWGTTIISQNYNLQDGLNKMWGKVLLSTSLIDRISETKTVKVGPLYYVIKTEEEDGSVLEPN